MKNSYEIRGNVTAIHVGKGGSKEIETLIDTRDLSKAEEFPNYWRAYFNKTTNSYYVAGTVARKGKTETIILHRLLTEAPKGLLVDHINHITLDNRRENLRFVTNAQNQQNRKTHDVRSKSKIRNVHWHKSSRTWEVQIKLNKKKIYIGTFKDIEKAKQAAAEARRKYFPYHNDVDAG